MWFLFILILVSAPGLTGLLLSAPRYKGPKSDHFDGKKFFTPGAEPPKGFGEVFKWMLNRKPGKWHKVEVKPLQKFELNPPGKGVRFVFINHSSFLIQFAGFNILTDPVFYERTSPFTFAGPKRMRPPGLSFSALPKIDLVILSHNHYDHLDIGSLKNLGKRFNPKFMVPLGVEAYLKNHGLESTELDWFQHQHFDKLKVMAVPAQHFSGRGTTDRDKTLWCGYYLTFQDYKLHFVGDTGYHPEIFKNIKEKAGSPDLSFIPIGAYKPRWFMSPVHVSPAKAVQIHQDLDSRQSVAMHFGTFPLADDGQDDPQTDLAKALSDNQIKQELFLIPEEGKIYEF